MKQDEYFFEAVKSWRQANKNLKHFAECCWHVSDRQTLALAQDCGCSPDTIANYRNAYVLFVELEGYRTRSAVWEKSPIALWVKAAQLRTRLNLSLAKTWDYLQTASEEGMTREQLAAHVDSVENNTPRWIRRLRSAIRFLSPSKDDWKIEMDMGQRERYDRAVIAFVAELEEISASGVEHVRR